MGGLLGYNLIRLEMVNIALEAKVEPTRISFTAAICIIDTQIRAYALSGKAPFRKNFSLCEKMLNILSCPKKENTERFHGQCYIPSRYPLRYKPKNLLTERHWPLTATFLYCLLLLKFELSN